MQVIKGFPPNFKDIVRVFPQARGQSTIFAYGDKIYIPGGAPLTPSLRAHEEAHGERQREIGVEAWWAQYLIDSQFRFDEELIGHRAEWKAFCRGVPMPSATHQRQMMKTIASRLSGQLYDGVTTYDEAERLIRDEPKKEAA